jgi:hypothetical protein
MRIKSWMLAPLAGALVAFGCSGSRDVKAEKTATPVTGADDDDDDGEEGVEEEIDLSEVPADVLAAAKAAVPGFVPREAERETENGVLVYCLEGSAGGEACEVEVSASGKVLEIERGDDEEEEDDG